MIKRNLLQPELLENFIPATVQEQQKKADRILLFTFVIIVAGIGFVWLLASASKPPNEEIREEKRKQL